MKSLLDDEPEPQSPAGGGWTEKLSRRPEVMSLFDNDAYREGASDDYPTESTSTESAGENVRRSGLAWSAGIAFFGSVVFMMLLGWFADLLFGSSPWGMVGGIILGSVIGFVQFFRLTSQIFKKQ